jgi:hypothetical protein
VPAAIGRLTSVSREPGHDRRDAGACHAAAYRRIRLVSPDRDLPDRNTADVRDRVSRSGLQIADPQAKVA